MRVALNQFQRPGRAATWTNVQRTQLRAWCRAGRDRISSEKTTSLAWKSPDSTHWFNGEPTQKWHEMGITTRRPLFFCDLILPLCVMS